MSENIKAKLADALIELTDYKSLDKITVKDLVEKCSISRQTFYYHYQDIVDVIEWILSKFTESISSKTVSAKTPQEALTIFVDFVFESSNLVRKLTASRHREYINRLIIQSIQTHLESMYLEKAPSPMMNFTDLKVAIKFHSYGLAGLLLESVDAKDIDRELLINQIHWLLSDSMIKNEGTE